MEKTPRVSPLESMPSGLASLPRQLGTFADFRQQLLERLADPNDAKRQRALGEWRPSGDDYGLMWLEMWAYVSDVLAFYDERIANESYLGTAARRQALRRLVQLLGYSPRPGIAASSAVAAIAEGKVATTIPPGTGFRSRGFDNLPPQVFETSIPTSITPLLNSWTVAPFRRRPTVAANPLISTVSPTVDKASKGGNSGKNNASFETINSVSELLMEPIGFGLAVDELVVIEARDRASDFEAQLSLVTATESFTGKDGKIYTKVLLDPAIAIDTDVDLSGLRARRPTQTIRPTTNQPVDSDGDDDNVIANSSSASGEQLSKLYLDQVAVNLRQGTMLVAVQDNGVNTPSRRLVSVQSVSPAAVRVTSTPAETVEVPDPTLDPDPDPAIVTLPLPKLPTTCVEVQPRLPSSFASSPDTVTLHYAFTNGGNPTNTCKLSITADELSDPEGVPIHGTVSLPDSGDDVLSQFLSVDDTGAGHLEQRFLFSDAGGEGFVVDGRLTVGSDGRASFRALVREQLTVDSLRLPLTLYGNIVDTTRGQSVVGEVLGSGDARNANQQFKLKKKPLTYLHIASGGDDGSSQSTLSVTVDGILWQEVSSFFGCGATDEVFVVHHDDAQNTLITFGDGERGARLSSGVGNVIANYRFGAGEAAPPADHIKQLAAAVKGLRAVKSPVKAMPGKDADSAEHLRGNAPQAAMLLGRAVSVADFEALTLDAPGIVSARAQWLWIESQLQAGVVVHYIGETSESVIRDTLLSRADPTVALEVIQAQAISATVAVGIQIDPRYSTETMAEALRGVLSGGVLSINSATIGGTFWASQLQVAAAGVEGVIAIDALSFGTGIAGPTIVDSGGTCIETGKYLDFSADNAITVSAVHATDLAPAPLGGHS